MQATIDDPESWASLQGLKAMLALPEVRVSGDKYARRRVEVQVSPSTWEVIDAVDVVGNSIVFSVGANGSRREFVFALTAPIPAWRMETAR